MSLGDRRSVSRHIDDLSLIDAVSLWIDVVQGRAPAAKSLQELCRALGAEGAGIARDEGYRHEAVRFVGHDRSNPLPSRHRIDRSFARAVLGPYAGRARAATIWTSEAMTDPDAELAELQDARGLRELIVIPLGRIDRGEDYLEIHFAHAVGRDCLDRLEVLAQTFSDRWKNRDPGLFLTRMLTGKRRTPEPVEMNILAFGNPARLSRAEFRICLLLSQGRSNDEMCDDLGISMATVRSHLRNIYEKTGAEGKEELLFKLLSGSFRRQDRA